MASQDYGYSRFFREYPIWLEKNFPDTTPDQQLMGIVEEVGELAHAVLKGKQRIRHTPAEIQEMKEDAVADIFVFLYGFCHVAGIDFEAALDEAWSKVRERDWTAERQAREDQLRAQYDQAALFADE